MSGNSAKKFWMLPAVFCGVWLILRFLLPLVFPFLLGAALALLAEPAVAFLHRKLGIKRGFASALGVLCAIVLLISLFLLLISLMVKELGLLAGALPDMESTLLGWLTGMQDFLLSITDLTPDGIRPLLNRSVLNLFSSGTFGAGGTENAHCADRAAGLPVQRNSGDRHRASVRFHDLCPASRAERPHCPEASGALEKEAASYAALPAAVRRLILSPVANFR